MFEKLDFITYIKYFFNNKSILRNQMNNDLERFDTGSTTDDTLETMTQLTEPTTNEPTGFGTTTSGVPPITTGDNDFTNTPNVKQKSKLPLIIGGAVGMVAVASVGIALLAGGSSQPPQDTENVAQVASDANAIPTLDDPNESASDVKVSSDVASQTQTQASEPQFNTASSVAVAVAPEQAASNPFVNNDKTLNNPMAASQTNANLNQPTEEKKPADTASSTPTFNATTALPPEPSTPMQKPATPTVQVPQEQNNFAANQSGNAVNVTESVSNTNTNANKEEADRLRQEAQKLLEQAKSLETQSNLDMLLSGKTQDEQIAILKQRLIDVQNELNKRNNNVCVKKNTNERKVKRTLTHNKNRTNKSTRASKYHVTGIVEGQIWIKDGNSSQSYVVGDKLPNGARIKSINYDDKTIVTDNGRFKVR